MLMQQIDLTSYLAQIEPWKSDGVKGDHGRVLVIGGSELFHAASFWSASMASRLVDMVHFSSPVMENNDLMRVRAKEKFWDGIVVPYEEIDHYIEEDDSILIGPGMERGATTKTIIDSFLFKYPTKKWIIDGGALQEVDPKLLTSSMIITPNSKELSLLTGKLEHGNIEKLPCTILAKGPADTITAPSNSNLESSLSISGGSPGMTKGGTGDVLAGLLAGLYANSPALPSCVIASYTCKLASETLDSQLGPFFSPLDLIVQIPQTLTSLIRST